MESGRLRASATPGLSGRLRASGTLRKSVRLFGSALLAGATLLAIRGISFGNVFERIGSFPPWILCFAVLMAVVQIAAQAVRLWLVFPRPRRPRFWQVGRAFAFGQLANACLPARAGDVLKVTYLSNKRSGTTSVLDATGALLADKGLDAAATLILTVAFGGTLLHVVAGGVLHLALFAGCAVFLVGLALLAARFLMPALFAKLIEGGRALLVTLRDLTPLRFCRGVLLGMMVTAAEIAVLMVLTSALGSSLGVSAALCVFVILCVGIAVPISVANVGAFEAAMVLGLSRYGVSAADAIAIATVHHLMQIVAVLLVASAFWCRDRVHRARPGLVLRWAGLRTSPDTP